MWLSLCIRLYIQRFKASRFSVWFRYVRLIYLWSEISSSWPVFLMPSVFRWDWNTSYEPSSNHHRASTTVHAVESGTFLVCIPLLSPNMPMVCMWPNVRRGSWLNTTHKVWTVFLLMLGDVQVLYFVKYFKKRFVLGSILEKKNFLLWNRCLIVVFETWQLQKSMKLWTLGCFSLLHYPESCT